MEKAGRGQVCRPQKERAWREDVASGVTWRGDHWCYRRCFLS